MLGPAACGKTTVLRVLKEALGGLPESHGGGKVRNKECAVIAFKSRREGAAH